MSLVSKLSVGFTGSVSKAAAKMSKSVKLGVKTVAKNDSETITTISKTGTQVRTYDDKALKIVDFGKNSDMHSKFGLSQMLVDLKNKKVLTSDLEGKTKKYTMQEFGNWMKFLRNHMKKYNLNGTYI